MNSNGWDCDFRILFGEPLTEKEIDEMASPPGSRRAQKNEMNTGRCARLPAILTGSVATSAKHGHAEDGRCAPSSQSR